MTAEAYAAMVPSLLDWYHDNRRALPWRDDPTPYHVWLSEIMLQQTRVAAVMGYYTRFLEALPTVEALAAAPEDTLLKLWQGLGYYSRARNLQKAAKLITAELGGNFPSAYEELLKLPGVGEYTAGAIASIAFGEAVPAVDGNVLRVVARVTGDRGDITLPETKRRVRAFLGEIMPRALPGEFNQALMELGALVCLPNGEPDCERCPVRDLCAARLEGLTHELPVKKQKAPRRVEERTVYLIFRGDRVALCRRPETGLLARLWEFPNELSSKAPDFVGKLSVLAEGPKGKHIFTHREWRMSSQVCALRGEELPEGWVWADAAELAGRYAVPSAFDAFRPLVRKLLWEARQTSPED